MGGDTKSHRTRCPNDHPFTPENTIIVTTKTGTYRRCRTCYNATQRRWRRKHREGPP
jgi:hypothetical protein